MELQVILIIFYWFDDPVDSGLKCVLSGLLRNTKRWEAENNASCLELRYIKSSRMKLNKRVRTCVFYLIFEIRKKGCIGIRSSTSLVLYVVGVCCNLSYFLNRVSSCGSGGMSYRVHVLDQYVN